MPARLLTEYMHEDTLDKPRRYRACPICGQSDTNAGVMVWRTERGWSIYCHYCKQTKFIWRDGIASPSAIISRLNAPRRNGNQQGAISLPPDFELVLPAHAKRWLHKYGVTNSEAVKYRFGYSPSMDRLIMPVFKDDQLVFWQGRRLSGDQTQPKYISMSVSRTNTWFELIKPGATEVVLVEDIVSAVVVRRAGFSAIALLGIYANSSLPKRLKEKGISKVCVWLDPDKRKISVQTARRMSGLGFSATALVTPTKDPKDYSVQQTREYLEKGGFKYEDVQEIGTPQTSANARRQASVLDPRREGHVDSAS